MAILHQATLSPSKLEILSTHLLTLEPFADRVAANVSLVAAYRFDDPAGRVGIESHLIDDGTGRIVHIPLTYRETPLEGAEHFLISTMEHSVLGSRWVYNACGDPVYVAELTRAILTGSSSVEQFVETPDGLIPREATASAAGTGSPGAEVPTIDSISVSTNGTDTIITAGGIELVVHHLPSLGPANSPALVGRWAGQDQPTVLASIS